MVFVATTTACMPHFFMPWSFSAKLVGKIGTGFLSTLKGKELYGTTPKIDRFLTFCLLINTLLSKVIGADLCKNKQEDKITENQRSRESKDMQDNRSAAHGGGRCKFLVASL